MGRVSQVKNGKGWFSSETVIAGKLRSHLGSCQSSPVRSPDSDEASLKSRSLMWSDRGAAL